MPTRVKFHLFLAYQSLVYAGALLVLCGIILSWGEWYSTSSYHRRQSNALLQGELALSHNPANLAMDLCWSEGGVQQVWGLGIPLWRLPFNAIARVFGYPAFPDRIALGIFMALAAYVAGRTWLNDPIEKNSTPPTPKVVVSGAVILFLFFAPAINLLRSPLDHYDEPLAYVYYFGILLACGVYALAKIGSWRRFWLLCALAGIGGLIRPTLVLYGFATMAITSLIMFQHERRSSLNPAPKARSLLKFLRNPRFVLGIVLFVCGGGVLFITNYLRFGNGWEFGHRLNVSPALPSVYTTRFDYPFKHIPFAAAARELFGALFMVNHFNGVAWYQHEIFTGQSSTIRWRGFNMRTYDLSYAVLLAVAWAIVFSVIVKRLGSTFTNRKTSLPAASIPFPNPLWLTVWGIVATALLAAFYLRVPAIADRYMLDFAPAFVASLTGIWLWSAAEISRKVNRSTLVTVALLVALIGWQSWELALAKSRFGSPHSKIADEGLSLPSAPRPMPPPLPKEYKIGDQMKSFEIPYNGVGWHSTDGQVWACAVFYVEDPKFLNLELAPATNSSLTESDLLAIHAKVGLEFLKRNSITPKNGGWVLSFAGPKQSRYQNGLQTVYLAMVPQEQLDQYVIPPTPWILKSLSWRGE